MHRVLLTLLLLSISTLVFAQPRAALDYELSKQCRLVHALTTVVKNMSYDEMFCYDQLADAEAKMDAICYAIDQDIYQVATYEIKQVNKILYHAEDICLEVEGIEMIRELYIELLKKLSKKKA